MFKMCFNTNIHVSQLISAILVLMTGVYVYENERAMLKLRDDVQRIAGTESNNRKDVLLIKKDINELFKSKEIIKRMEQEANENKKTLLQMQTNMNNAFDSTFELQNDIKQVADNVSEIKKNMLQIQGYMNQSTKEFERLNQPGIGHPIRDCSDFKAGMQNGVYKIYPEGAKSFKVYCDMVTDGGGWTVVE